MEGAAYVEDAKLSVGHPHDAMVARGQISGGGD
jgi:hypothetical protein